jgi:hypothetical protein
MSRNLIQGYREKEFRENLLIKLNDLTDEVMRLSDQVNNLEELLKENKKSTKAGRPSKVEG